MKKDLDFQSVLQTNFTPSDLEELFELLPEISQLNGKELVQIKVDGSKESVRKLAEKLDFLAPALSNQEVEEAIDQVMKEQAQVVQKILKTGKTGPVMALVGQSMKKLNKRGDPKVIQGLIEERLDRLK